MGGYRGASVKRELRGDLNCVASTSGASSASFACKGSSFVAHADGTRLSDIVGLSGKNWLVFVLEWFVCGTVTSAYVDELKRASNAKEKSELCFVIAKKYAIFMSIAG